jgi:hypothetical protein
MSILGESLIASLPSQHMGDSPSKCETGTRVLTHLANCYARIWLGVGTVPSHLVVCSPRSGGTVLATDLYVLIVHPFRDGRPLIYSVECQAACKVLG